MLTGGWLGTTDDGSPVVVHTTIYRLTMTMSPLKDWSISVAPASPNDPRTERLRRPGPNEFAGRLCNVSA
jgi:hypothetical protein